MIGRAHACLTLPLVGRVGAQRRGGGGYEPARAFPKIPPPTPDPSPQGGGESNKRLGCRETLLTLAFLILSALPALAASGREPPPSGAFEDAPPQYTRFTAAELTRGFLNLAFGSDLRIGAKPAGIRRFEHPIRVRVTSSGSVDRSAQMHAIIEQYAHEVPNLRMSVAAAGQPADIDVRLIDEGDLEKALVAAFGAEIARVFVARTNPQCMTSVKSNPEGDIVHAMSFIIVDKGNRVFLDCAYHELLHAFGLSNHDPRNRWTTLNQRRMVGYLSVYDRSLLMLLYDPRLKPGMSPARVRAVLPAVISELRLAAPKRR